MIEERYKEPPLTLDTAITDWYDRSTAVEEDHFMQPGPLFRQVMKESPPGT